MRKEHDMLDALRYERIVMDRYRYRGFHGCESWCGLEIIPIDGGKTVIIATELADNPGTSVTNICEDLASVVCVELAIDPSSLVWIEYYDFPSACNPKLRRTYH